MNDRTIGEGHVPALFGLIASGLLAFARNIVLADTVAMP